MLTFEESIARQTALHKQLHSYSHGSPMRELYEKYIDLFYKNEKKY